LSTKKGVAKKNFITISCVKSDQEIKMRTHFMYIPDLPDKDGRPVPFHVQILAYLIWTAPERGMTMRDFRKTLRRVGAHFGVRIGWWSAVVFTRNAVRLQRATRSWTRAEYYLDDAQMNRRQTTVFQQGLRGTLFDKMDRIRERAMIGTEFRKMGPETCDVEELFRELDRVDLSLVMSRGERPAQPFRMPGKSLDEIIAGIHEAAERSKAARGVSGA